MNNEHSKDNTNNNDQEITDKRKYDRIREEYMAMGETAEMTERVVAIFKSMDIHLVEQVKATEEAEARARNTGKTYGVIHYPNRKKT